MRHGKARSISLLMGSLVVLGAVTLVAAGGCSSHDDLQHPPDACTNGQKDANEVGVDCGGPCPRCANGTPCQIGADCVTRLCVDGVCASPTTPTCGNGQKDGDETDVDCGGTCATCVDGKVCGSDRDCAGKRCVQGACQSESCHDDAKDQNESDVDCGGTFCQACANTKSCNSASDCQSNHCTNGVCVAAGGASSSSASSSSGSGSTTASSSASASSSGSGSGSTDSGSGSGSGSTDSGSGSGSGSTDSGSGSGSGSTDSGSGSGSGSSGTTGIVPDCSDPSNCGGVDCTGQTFTPNCGLVALVCSCVP